jgi:hypothetical protein
MNKVINSKLNLPTKYELLLFDQCTCGQNYENCQVKSSRCPVFLKYRKEAEERFDKFIECRKSIINAAIKISIKKF